MKIPLPITPAQIPALRELGQKYGVTWKGRDFTDSSPTLTDTMSSLLSEFDADIAFQAVRQTSTLSDAQALARRMVAAAQDTAHCGSQWRAAQLTAWFARREKRIAAALRRQELGPYIHLSAVLPLLNLPLDHASIHVDFLGRAENALPDAEKTHLPELEEYGDDPIAAGSCSGNWTTLPVPAHQFGADHLCRHQPPALVNLRNHWQEFCTRYGVDCAYAHCSIGSQIHESGYGYTWSMRITFEANTDVCWILDGYAGVKPTRYLILLACFSALIEAGHMGNPCLDHPHMLDSRENYDQTESIY